MEKTVISTEAKLLHSKKNDTKIKIKHRRKQSNDQYFELQRVSTEKYQRQQ